MKITLITRDNLDVAAECQCIEESLTVDDLAGMPFPSTGLMFICDVALKAAGTGHPRFELHLADGYPGEMVALFECIEAFCASRSKH